MDIIKLYKRLKENKEYIISKQILRSATSIGANVNESISTQTKKDFITKMSIASKEAMETNYMLTFRQTLSTRLAAPRRVGCYRCRKVS